MAHNRRKYFQGLCFMRLVFRVYKEPLQLNHEKKNDQILKWTKDLDRHSPKNIHHGQ